MAAELEEWDVEGERASMRGRALRGWLAKPTVAVRLSNAAIERRLGAAAPGT